MASDRINQNWDLFLIRNSKARNIYYKAINALDSFMLSDKHSVVFDIDDTLIDGNDRPITPIIDLYNHVLSEGLTPVIITNRPGIPATIEYTKNQLRKHGIKDYKYIYFRPEHVNDPYGYKTESRRLVHTLGYTVVMSIGDQPWDIGMYGGIGIIV
jgi:hypothetical protein